MNKNNKDKCIYCECYKCILKRECFECYSCRNSANFTDETKQNVVTEKLINGNKVIVQFGKLNIKQTQSIWRIYLQMLF